MHSKPTYACTQYALSCTVLYMYQVGTKLARMQARNWQQNNAVKIMLAQNIAFSGMRGRVIIFLDYCLFP